MGIAVVQPILGRRPKVVRGERSGNSKVEKFTLATAG